ncbi:hypothetical protein [Variovorax sp. LG9.2]|uniref:hypothetical protein n=1 Tax=Variovorax sp. LG9.2 TaxID=3048626 RepID=UPI002B22DCF8|nr:hypothetical protein [Variovorax sp. LG9.2]MEB0058800.1 hypothetical protein [Variovorax sp. LG9.2]
MNKMIKLLYSASVLALLGGCAFSHQITGPDGKPMHTISCNGAGNSISSCYEKAGELCGTAGYDILDRDGSSSPFGVATGTVRPGYGGYTSTYGAIVTRNLFVRCKVPS